MISRIALSLTSPSVIFRVAHVEGERDRVGAPVLHGDVEVDEVLVLRKHPRLIVESLDRPDIDDAARLDRPRNVQSRCRAPSCGRTCQTA